MNIVSCSYQQPTTAEELKHMFSYALDLSHLVKATGDLHALYLAASRASSKVKRKIAVAAPGAETDEEGGARSPRGNGSMMLQLDDVKLLARATSIEEKEWRRADLLLSTARNIKQAR